MENSKSIYRALARALAGGKSAAVITATGGDGMAPAGAKALFEGSSMVLADGFSLEETGALESDTAAIEGGGYPQHRKITTASGRQFSYFYHSYTSRPRLIILGGGHVGAALCRFASGLDYEVTVVDDRPAFASPDCHPGADHLICAPFDDIFKTLDIRASDYIIIVTRGHRHDLVCLKQALNCDPAYTGMIGSRSRVAAQKRELLAGGYSQERLDAVYSPVGLPIGAVTEGEIAISILAQVTSVRRQPGSKGETFAAEFIEELVAAEKEKLPCALVTIVESVGSTPRKKGAQMLVYPDGRTSGTIGGGCVEAEARLEALHALDLSQAKMFRVDLTDSQAAAEGMACGGFMELIVELLQR